MQTFGQRLKYAILAAETNQTKLADRLGRTKGAVSQWVNDETEPDLAMLGKICTELHISADFLVRGIALPYMDQQTAAIVDRVSALDDSQREGLYGLIFGKAIPDGTVERKMPITAKLKRPLKK